MNDNTAMCYETKNVSTDPTGVEPLISACISHVLSRGCYADVNTLQDSDFLMYIMHLVVVRSNEKINQILDLHLKGLSAMRKIFKSLKK